MEEGGCIAMLFVLAICIAVLMEVGKAIAGIPSWVWETLVVVLVIGGVGALLAYLTRHDQKNAALKGEIVKTDDPPMQMPMAEAIARALAERAAIQESNRKVNVALEARAALVNPTLADIERIRRPLSPDELAVFDIKWRRILDDIDTTRPPHQQSRPQMPGEMRDRMGKPRG